MKRTYSYVVLDGTADDYRKIIDKTKKLKNINQIGILMELFHILKK